MRRKTTIAALGVGFARVGIETRLRATEARVAAANGLDVRERWVDVVSPAVRVRVLDSGTGDPVLFINGISAPGIGMAPLDRPSRVARVVLVGQPAGAIAGARADLSMGMLTAPVLGRVATWMARLPLPRF